MSRKRESIDLKTKYKILKDIERGIGYKIIVSKYGLKSKNNVSRIKGQKEMIEKAIECGEHISMRKVLRKPKFSDIDEKVIDWFRYQKEQNNTISGRIIQEVAKQYASDLGIQEFCASDGWLYKWRKRYDITFGKVVSQSSNVEHNVVDYQWSPNSSPETILPSDVFSSDETKLFYRLEPNKTLNEKWSSCKQSNDRITVLRSNVIDESTDTDFDLEDVTQTKQRIPNFKEVMDCITTLKSYFEYNNEFDDNLLKSLKLINQKAIECENQSKQTKITDFFPVIKEIKYK